MWYISLLLPPFFLPKTRQDSLYNTKLTYREIEPFFLAMIPEDLEAKKQFTSDHEGTFEQIYTLFHENTKKGKKLVKKLICKNKYRTNHVNE